MGLCSSVLSELRGILERIEVRIKDLEGTLFEEISGTLLPLVTEVMFVVRKFLYTSSVCWKEPATYRISDIVACTTEYNKLLDDVQYKNETGLKGLSLMLATDEEPLLLSISTIDIVCGLLHHQASHIAGEVTRWFQDANKLGILEKRLDDWVDDVVMSVGGKKQSVIVNVCQSLAWDLAVPGYVSGVASGSGCLSCDGCRQCVKISICSLCVMKVFCNVLVIDQVLFEELKSLWLSPGV
jgi:hypothetical protein